MKAILAVGLARLLARLLALAAVLIVGEMVAGAISQRMPQPPIPDAGGLSPVGMGTAMVIVTCAWTVLLALLSQSAAVPFARRAGFLFVLFFVVNCALSATEAAFFLTNGRLAGANIAAMVVDGLLVAALIAPCAAALFPPRDPQASGGMPRSSRPAAAVVAMYVVTYSIAGYFVAWQSAAVRAYYGDGLDIALLPMLALQIARAVVWTAILMMVVRNLQGSRVPLALLVGAGFAAFMALPLLLPGPLMPWPVRSVHLAEIGLSNFLFGVAGFLWLTADRGRSLPRKT